MKTANSHNALSRLQELATKHNLPLIGCSSVAAAIGESKFEDATPLSVYRRLIDNVKPEPSKAMLIGRYFEDGVYQLLTDEYGITCTERQSYVTLPPLHGYIDGRINETTILEIKTTARGWEVMPQEYIVQANLYMLLAKAQLCTFAVFTFANQELDIHTIVYDDDLTTSVLSRLADFYEQYVIPRTPPPPLQPKEYRESISIEQERVTELSCVDLLRDIRELKRQQDAIEKLIDEKKFELELALGGAAKGTLNGRTVAYYQQSNYKRIDTDRLKNAYPEVYRDCLKDDKPTLRFMIRYNELEAL